MKRYSTRAQLKAIARQQLLGNYLPLAGAFLLLTLLRNFITAPVSLLALPEPYGSISYYAADFVLGLFFAIFQVGISYLFLSNACGQQIRSSQLYMGFSLGPMKAVSIWIVPALPQLIPTLLPDLLLNWILDKKGTELIWYMALWLLVIVPLSSLVSLLVELPFSMVFYIMLDFPEMEAAECRRYSIKLMKGNKWRYCKLILSFVPLYLLGLLTFGLGLLYVLPYRAQTCANFYLDLMMAQESM